ncbi:MAG: twin-arginine translocase subunit TatC [Planctomycetota bacterium]|nr:twin-arginine translocase subunit TatC [Planctomycetota bacterium]
MTSVRSEFDPDEFQMSIGDHLEELRRRILYGLAGLVPAAIVCLIFGRRILAILCWPLIRAQQKYDISPQLYSGQLPDAFMVYIKLSMIAAACIAGPWIVFQIWKFVASGLYPNERQYITKFIPLSLTLLITGMLFVYFLVLPLSLQFFISFATELPLPTIGNNIDAAPGGQSTFIQHANGDPAKPGDYQIWFNTNQDRLKMFIGGKIRVIPFGPDNLVTTQFTLSDYLDLVLQLLLTFGLAFQLPLVVMALARVGIVDIQTLRNMRRYVYFGLCVLAAALSPGDVVTATIALLVPLIFLYEFGIFLAKLGPKPVKGE